MMTETILVNKMSKVKEGTTCEIEAETGKGFQEYKYADGSKVPSGTPIGKEIFSNGEWKLKLYDGIFFSDEAGDDDE